MAKEELDEETKESIGELLEGYRPSTKGGGYEEIPEDIVKEAARRVGLPEEEIPEVRVEETSSGCIDKTPEGKTFIVIPRREPKWKVPDTLRHELSHVKYGYVRDVPYGESTCETYIKNELGALQIQGNGRLTSNDLASLVLTLVLEEGQPKRESTTLVMDEARGMGTSERSITVAKRWLRNHWKRLKELEGY